MPNQATPPRLTLPMQVCRRFFHWDYHQIISEVCVSLDKAMPGDIVALCMDGDQSSSSGFHTGSVRNVILRKDGDEQAYELIPFSKLSEKRQREVAYTCMVLQNCDIIAEGPIRVMLGLMTSSTPPVSLTLLTDAAFLTDCNLYANFFNWPDRNTLQPIADEGIRALLKQQATSAHELLEMKPALDLILDFANTFWAASGPKFGDPAVPFALPRLDGLLGEGVARDPQ
jgi:hypothetical protein